MRKKVYKRRRFGAALRYWLNISGLLAVIFGLAIALGINQNFTPLSRVEAQTQKALHEVPIDGGQVIVDTLSDYFTQFEKDAGGDVAIQFSLLNSKFEQSSNSNLPMKTASLYKLFVAHRALELVDDGILILSQDITKKDNLLQCIDKMITLSDNDCGLALQELINPYKTNQVLKTRGFNSTDISGEYPTTTAFDTQRLIKDIYRQQTLSPEFNKLLLNMLRNQKLNHRLNALLVDTVFAHKTGDLNDISHDAGIFYTEKADYALIVMSSGSKLNKADYNRLAANLSLKVYNLVQSEL